MSVSLCEIRERWTINDVIDANDVLDALEDAEARAAARSKR